MIYNSPIEIGLRSLILLYFKPDKSNIDSISLLDYITIYSEDFKSDLKNIHPNLPLKLGEITSKRNQIKKGLNLLIMKGLIKKKFTDKGIEYHITKSGEKFVELLTSDYANGLKERANWSVNEFKNLNSLELYDEILKT